MLQDKNLTHKKLTGLWENNEVKVLDQGSTKYVIVSDLHLGDGDVSDDFVDNEATFLKALQFYRENGYHLILLGDIEEFWLFDIDSIVKRYNNSIYEEIRAFGDGRVHRVFGNHDSEWGRLKDPTRNTPLKVNFASEALKMRSSRGDVRIMLIHGHQGSRNSDKSSWISRFFVRLFKKLKPVAKKTRILRHKSATKSQIPRSYEKTLYSWAKDHKVILICGHTHRAIFASKSFAARLRDEIHTLSENGERDPSVQERTMLLKRRLAEERLKDRDIEECDDSGDALPCYFNAGCALYHDGITVIEVNHDELRLVKWHKLGTSDQNVQVYGEGSIQTFLDQIDRGSVLKASVSV